MKHEVLKLKDLNKKIKSEAILRSYIPDNFDEFSKGRKRKCILVFPGGGYEFVSDRENEPIALKLISEDIAVFTLTYSVIEFKYPYPFVEAFAALAYIRENAEKYNIDPNKIAVMGFSAGGHLAAFTSMNSESDKFAKLIGKSKELIKVNGCILSYPVVYTGKDNPFDANLKALRRNMPDHLEETDIIKNCTSSFPKTFVWTTQNDNVVPCLNSIDLVKKLTELGVFCEFHLFPNGAHGLSLANEIVSEKDVANIDPFIKTWINYAIHFVKTYL